MKYIGYSNPILILADEGKHIRDINDVYVPEHYDEEGELVPEHIPHCSDMIFLASGTTEEQALELYVEEIKR